MPYRILSLDGGGIRGVISATILAELERQLDQPLNQYFNLIAGTSTGALLAAAIAMGKPSQDIIELYKQNGSKIFPYQSRWSPQRVGLVLQYGFSAPKFSDKGLIEALKGTFGNTKLSDVTSSRLLITSYDTIGREPIIFKSWRKDDEYAGYSQLPLWEVCVCSASAPTFFPAHRLETNGKTYSAIDGGVVANNPSSCALAEALRLEYPVQKITLLSIGTGDLTRPIPLQKAQEWGALQWAIPIIDVLFDATSDAYDYITKQVLDQRYLRLHFELDRELTGKRLSDDIDDVSAENINNLIEAANAYVKQTKVQTALKDFLTVSA